MKPSFCTILILFSYHVACQAGAAGLTFYKKFQRRFLVFLFMCYPVLAPCYRPNIIHLQKNVLIYQFFMRSLHYLPVKYLVGNNAAIIGIRKYHTLLLFIQFYSHRTQTLQNFIVLHPLRLPVKCLPDFLARVVYYNGTNFAKKTYYIVTDIKKGFQKQGLPVQIIKKKKNKWVHKDFERETELSMAIGNAIEVKLAT